MGRPKKQVEAATPLPIKKENEVENGLRDGRQEEKEEEKGQVKLVKMYRSENYPEPRMADVHPDEVDNYAKGGFVVIKE
ncbi:MAG TPA: hypothetical protein VFM18_09865 [Methanosarcina sp.]|nr:hypothetical protein [Methanosarcina sp.]